MFFWYPSTKGLIIGLVVILCIFLIGLFFQARKKAKQDKPILDKTAKAVEDIMIRYTPIGLLLCVHNSGVPSILSDQRVFLIACEDKLTIQAELNSSVIVNLEYSKIASITKDLGENSVEFLRINYKTNNEMNNFAFSFSGTGISLYNKQAALHFSADFVELVNSKIQSSQTVIDL